MTNMIYIIDAGTGEIIAEGTDRLTVSEWMRYNKLVGYVEGDTVYARAWSTKMMDYNNDIDVDALRFVAGVNIYR